MVMRIERKLAARIEREFNWKDIPEIIIQDGYEDVNEDGDITHRLYLGSVFSVMPSGKYYTPFATGNLSNCECCQGTGHVSIPGSNRRRLSGFKAAKKLDEQLTGKALKRFGSFHSWPEEVKVVIFAARKNQTVYARKKACPNCNGYGTREAYLDEIYMEILKEKAGEIGMFIENGEGDPCDLFIVWISDEKAEPDDEVESEFDENDPPDTDDMVY